MITCPECGQAAADDAQFCDRCGQGLAAAPHHPAPASLPPLAPSAELRHGYRIVALIRQSSNENRYRAERLATNESCELRERIGQAELVAVEPVVDTPTEPVAPAPALDPAGPQAKTAELKPPEWNRGANGAAPPPNPAPDAAAVQPAAAHPQGSDSPSTVPAQAAVDGEGASLATDAPAEVAAAPATEADAAISSADSAPVDQNRGNSETAPTEDLGEVFGRVWALSQTLNHPAFQCATDAFAEDGRVYLAYREDPLTLMAKRSGGLRVEESEALGIGIQLCQAVSFAHRRGLRVNDICPDSVAIGPDGRIQLTGLDYVSNDNELQADPVFNDGYTAPEIYRAKQPDKRADVFAVGALLYTCLTGERLEAESWREEAGPIRFYPPHVVSPAVEQAVRRALLFDPAARWAGIDAFKNELLRLTGIVHITAAGLTDVGMVRELNEDAVMMLEYWRDSQIAPVDGFLYVIADGMGGAEAGEVASAIAVGSIREHCEKSLGSVRGADLGPALQEALEVANRQVVDYQAAHQEARGMGSTAVGALVVPPDAAIAWVGDSRAYLSQESGLRQLSKDHSLVQRLLEIGQITAEEARHHEHKNVITRSLGARAKGPAGAEFATVRLKRGDRLLLCSDGLTAHVTDPAIAEILRRHRGPYAAARELIAAANAGGGTDNISVVVIFAN
jgi:serine/threonine protein phosphatase PrpC